MAFIFPKNDREIFPKTFLKDISVSFDFNKVSEERIRNNSLTTFFSSKFEITGLDSEQFASGLEVQSQDEQVKFIFASDHVCLKMKFPAYRSFDFALQWLEYMLDYLRSLEVYEITSLIIGKYNQLQYEIPQNPPKDISVGTVMKEIFSSALLKYDFGDETSFEKESEKFNSLARWEKRIIINDEEFPNLRFIIEYGFRESDDRRGKGELTLKTLINNESNISISEIKLTMNKLNEIIDDGFRWCVGDNIIEQMRNKE